MEKCLYVSDLDGTLLRSDETISEYTCNVINKLTENGGLFSYATARSYVTAKKVTKGLDAKIPLIVYNGAFVIDNVSEEILISNYFHNEIKEVLTELFANDIYPIVYSYIDTVEYFSFLTDKCNDGMWAFLNTRRGDKRWREVQSTEELIQGNMFYITCIDAEERLKPFFEKYKEKYHVVFQQDIYTKEQWLEIMPLEASKANAILQLKELLKCSKVVSFGDGINDIDMFNISDEAYAVSNAVVELKQAATAVIGSNNEDGVAKWLESSIRIYQGADQMSGKIENINGKIIFSYTDGQCELRSHPYEPCLYIYKDDEMIKILHNAFEVYDLPAIFDSYGTVRAIDGRDYDREAFCKVLVAAINDERYEMNWTFAARLVV